ncbi:CpsD/CapB family tyrosine-protein kinase [Vaginisenegalia massiliensis]|uniref:CpsD/CapB family tyrosine-protein kinase n=1 Tax=Vaginisenegalia massiliensis TaxID=2058294 RepID=UPI000F541DE2|nr:CpsD/CapB family tyrosine-protein kinase [Vaginisenegalia massiliensis]
MFKNRQNLEKKLLKEQLHGASLITFTDPKSVNAEQFRALRTNIEFAQLDKQLKSLLVSSSIPTEGKSTISSNLAYVMGQTEKKVLIVDADLRKPTVHKTFKLNNEQGLSNLIVNRDMKFNEVVQHSYDLNLYFLPSGPIPPNPSELLSSARMNQIMQELSTYFDLVIYDAPPITAVADPQILATRVDGVLMVVRQNFAKKEEVRAAKKALDTVNANILGYVMNGKPVSNSSGYYAYYGYGEKLNDN